MCLSRMVNFFQQHKNNLTILFCNFQEHNISIKVSYYYSKVCNVSSVMKAIPECTATSSVKKKKIHYYYIAIIKSMLFFDLKLTVLP